MNPYESPTHYDDDRYRQTWKTLMEDAWWCFRDCFSWHSLRDLVRFTCLFFLVGVAVIYFYETSPVMRRLQVEINKQLERVLPHRVAK